MSPMPARVNGTVVEVRLTERVSDLTPRAYAAAFILVLAIAAALRGAFPLADPPWETPVGVVWHDEGAWTHNARNKALWGTWTVERDNWNPMYIAPVFTALEYASFEAFGVGLWQARVVSMLAGLVAVAALGAGIARIGGRGAGVIAAALLATNYVWVMYSRAALMEATMIAFVTAGWWAYARATTQRSVGAAVTAAACAWLAYFSKASGVFFVAALGLVCLAGLAETWWRIARRPPAPENHSRTASPGPGGSTPLTASSQARTEIQSGTGLRGAAGGRVVWNDPDARIHMVTLAALVLVGAAAFLAFVVPNLHEYVFYNWQMSVTRKPSYSLRAFVDRFSWFPLVHDIFTRMWTVYAIALVAATGMLVRLRDTRPAERLLLAWLVVGSAELLVHDVGNERRLVILIPALVGIAALALARDGRLLPASLAGIPRRWVWLASPVLLYLAYLVVGAVARLAFIHEIRPSVRLSAALAVCAVGALAWTWPRLPRLLSATRIPLPVALLVTGLLCAGDIVQYGQWAAGRTYENYGAMRIVAERLPPGTHVQGKLANGLALESRIVPVFVGRNFGNYDDRFTRTDAPYILTYVKPWVGYEGSVITEVLDAYPRRRVRWMVPVAESGTGEDMAALIEKTPAEVAGAHD